MLLVLSEAWGKLWQAAGDVPVLNFFLSFFFLNSKEVQEPSHPVNYGPWAWKLHFLIINAGGERGWDSQAVSTPHSTHEQKHFTLVQIADSWSQN